ncbi:hypothetical protein NCS57_01445400 [Fusarium keratoplasticum]|uniref:Uncharacterized protein n=1 Tax=Fusarium keratoplasticum TaxID=1328300 RepID=A0ACC0QCS4_9HYPO|nr:hypothetical protein NCS57_01445400 [Fusarium keratoplasticum]KAI8649093.1 hypothetical protein NCS57_01445400 [Fusarium keratoplasticum]
MNPSLIGADDWYNLVPLDNFPTCGNYMDGISCVGDLGFPPPGADKSAKFYAPGEFPKNGTETTISNLDVASVDAKPTGSAGGEKADSENEDSDEDDEEDVASLRSPQLWLIALICLILV